MSNCFDRVLTNEEIFHSFMAGFAGIGIGCAIIILVFAFWYWWVGRNR